MIKNKAYALLSIIAVGSMITAGISQQAAATNFGGEGCTPGFGKNHVKAWLDKSTFGPRKYF